MFSEIHNVMEDLVYNQVEAICDQIEANGGRGKDGHEICTCRQCRQDIACYVLNRAKPRYVRSNRGVARVERTVESDSQALADIAVLVNEGVDQVSRNKRGSADHQGHEAAAKVPEKPVYNIPTIVGRLFNGGNFEPIYEGEVSLCYRGGLAAMKDANWQNPCQIVPNTEGNFTFWPDVVDAEEAGVRTVFGFSLTIKSPGMETIEHFFNIPVTSEVRAASAFTLERVFRLPDIYMFEPGEAEQNG
jgi:competence protein ComFB